MVQRQLPSRCIVTSFRYELVTNLHAGLDEKEVDPLCSWWILAEGMIWTEGRILLTT